MAAAEDHWSQRRCNGIVECQNNGSEILADMQVHAVLNEGVDANDTVVTLECSHPRNDQHISEREEETFSEPIPVGGRNGTSDYQCGSCNKSYLSTDWRK